MLAGYGLACLVRGLDNCIVDVLKLLSLMCCSRWC